MQELSRAFKDRPMTPQESVVYWTEYVLRHNGTSHLKALGTDMPFYSYFMLDIAAFALLVASFVILAIYSITKTVYIFFVRKSKFAVSTKKKE